MTDEEIEAFNKAEEKVIDKLSTPICMPQVEHHLLRYIDKLEDRVNQLETKIDKAIDYIKENKDDVFWNEFRLDELLEILERGKE